MIEKGLQFEKCKNMEELHDLLRVFFSEKHFHLELACEEELPVMSDIYELWRLARKKIGRDQGVNRDYLELLRRCQPSRITNFTGLKKFKAFWWACVVELVDPTKGITRSGEMKTQVALLVGWDNSHGSGGRVMNVVDGDNSDDMEVLKEGYEVRVSQKVHNRYKTVHSIEYEEERENDVKLISSEELPEIDGLGEPVPREGEFFGKALEGTIEELLGGMGKKEKKGTGSVKRKPRKTLSEKKKEKAEEASEKLEESGLFGDEEVKEAKKKSRKRGEKKVSEKEKLQEMMKQRKKSSVW